MARITQAGTQVVHNQWQALRAKAQLVKADAAIPQQVRQELQFENVVGSAVNSVESLIGKLENPGAGS